MTGSANRNGIVANTATEPTPEKVALSNLAQCVHQLIEEVSRLKQENRRLTHDLAVAALQLQEARALTPQSPQTSDMETDWVLSASERAVLRERLLRLLEKIDLELQRYDS
jgi:hypothetical protein